MATFAGLCEDRGYAGDGGPLADARLNRPYGIHVSPAGDVYIADTHNHRVRVAWH
jgi:DNA-binding beta-propeller fold protein YncE